MSNDAKHIYTAYATVLIWVESDTELNDNEVEAKARDVFINASSNGGFRRDEIAIEWEAYL
jgi:hypothetical protein